MIRPLISALLVLVAAAAFGQANTPPTVKLVLPKDAKAGAKVQGTLQITFAEGLHGYQNPPSDKFQIPVTVVLDTKTFTLSKIAYPKGVSKATGGDPTPAAVYEGTIKIPVTITVPKKPGSVEVKFTVKYQQCNESSCYPPGDVSTSAKLLVRK